MKSIILILLLATASLHAGWFGSNDSNQQTQKQLQQTQAQLIQQQSATNRWQVIAGSFAIGCILLFVIGTAIGSKARREVRNG